MTQQQKDQIVHLRSSGSSYGKIAEYLGISVNTVKSFCKRTKIEGKADTNQSVDQTKETCMHCGQTLVQTPGHRQKKFCSATCRRAWWMTHPGSVPREADHACTCAFCGRAFQFYGNRPRKYCSRRCYQQYRIVKGGEGRG